MSTTKPVSTSSLRARAPIRRIAKNAGAEASIMVGKETDREVGSFGYDVQTGEYGDLRFAIWATSPAY